MLGTNTPSITSRWNQSHSLWLSISISRCKFAKSALSSEGETIVISSRELGLRLSVIIFFGRSLLFEIGQFVQHKGFIIGIA